MNPMDLAYYVTAYFDNIGDLVTNKKLQKLIYYVDAWHLVYFKVPIIEEDFEAWMFGPVVPSLYHELKRFGYAPVKIDYAQDETPIEYMDKLAKANDLSEDQLELIREVLLRYGSLSSLELETLSHEERPWKEARKNVPPAANCTRKISKTTMRDYYSRMIDGKE